MTREQVDEMLRKIVDAVDHDIAKEFDDDDYDELRAIVADYIDT